MNIYPIAQAYQTILDKANDYAEENEGETNEYLEQQLEQLGEDKNEAIIGMGYELKNMEAEAEALKNAAAEIAKKAKAVKEKIVNRKILIAKFSQGVTLTDGVIKIPKASSKSLVVYGEVPEEYKNTVEVPATIKTVIDNKTIKAGLLDGSIIADWAKIVEKKRVK